MRTSTIRLVLQQLVRKMTMKKTKRQISIRIELSTTSQTNISCKVANRATKLMIWAPQMKICKDRFWKS